MKAVTNILSAFVVLAFFAGFYYFISKTYLTFGTSALETNSLQNSLPVSPEYTFHLKLASLLNTEHDKSLSHFIMLILASIVLLANYFTFYQKYKSPFLALLGPLFILLNVRLVGNMPFLTLSTWFMLLFYVGVLGIYFFVNSKIGLKTENLLYIAFLGIVFGLSMGASQYGLLLFVVLAYSLFHKYLTGHNAGTIENKKDFGKHSFRSLVLILLVSVLTLVLTWPYLGSNFSAHAWQVFLPRQSIIVTEVASWEHNLVWLAVTIPLFILLSLALAFSQIKLKIQDSLFFIFWCALVLPLAHIVMQKPAAYNGELNYLFLFPIISSLAAMAFIHMHEATPTGSTKKLLYGVFFTFVAYGLYDIFSLHPYQSGYFNELVGKLEGARNLLELDTQQTAYTHAYDFIVKDADTQTVSVYTCAHEKYPTPGIITLTQDKTLADYIVCQNESTPIRTVFSIVRGGAELVSVKKL